jgi:hypothetical protein
VSDTRETSVQPSARERAKARGENRYWTGKPCKHGHIAQRYTRNGACCECSAIEHSRWQRDHAGHVREYRNAWRTERAAAGIRR